MDITRTANVLPSTLPHHFWPIFEPFPPLVKTSFSPPFFPLSIPTQQRLAQPEETEAEKVAKEEEDMFRHITSKKVRFFMGAWKFEILRKFDPPKKISLPPENKLKNSISPYNHILFLLIIISYSYHY